MVNAAQMLEEVHGRRGLCVAGGADHGLRRLVHQISDALEVDRKVTTLQSAAREGPRGSKKSLTDEAGGDGEQVHIRMRRRILRKNVRVALCVLRSIAMGGKTAERKLTVESELPSEHCGEAATRPGT